MFLTMTEVVLTVDGTVAERWTGGRTGANKNREANSQDA